MFLRWCIAPYVVIHCNRLRITLARNHANIIIGQSVVIMSLAPIIAMWWAMAMHQLRLSPGQSTDQCRVNLLSYARNMIAKIAQSASLYMLLTELTCNRVF